jgi:ribose 5-phosphate isomerase A
MDPDHAEIEKRAAAEAGAALVEDGMTVGLGTGSTVRYLLAALARAAPRIRCVASSPETERRARELGLEVIPFDRLEAIDLAIDGADQVDPAWWVVKGDGRAHTHEKIVAAAAARFVVIVSAGKLVERLAPPVPLEVLAFGAAATLRHAGPATLRDGPPSPDGGLIADYHGPVDDPRGLAARLDAVPGVLGHGLFAPELVSEVLVGRGAEAEPLRPAKPGPRS